MELFLPALLIIAGGYWSVKSFEYGLWVMNGPGGGMFPLAAGIMCVVFGFVILIREYKAKKPRFSIRATHPVIGVVAIILGSYAIGLIPAMSVFIVVWLFAYERYGFLKSASIGVGTGLCLYLVFDYWLKVPVPMGLFEDYLY